ncbi:hypothetical protein AB895_0922 [Acinetobacter baumannii]|nr:hypothetical protein AB895_0922 [Acinetobacter baumannii]
MHLERRGAFSAIISRESAIALRIIASLVTLFMINIRVEKIKVKVGYTN